MRYLAWALLSHADDLIFCAPLQQHSQGRNTRSARASGAFQPIGRVWGGGALRRRRCYRQLGTRSVNVWIIEAARKATSVTPRARVPWSTKEADMKRCVVIAAAALMLTLLLPDGAFAQRRGGGGGMHIGGGGMGLGGFRGGAMGLGGFRAGGFGSGLGVLSAAIGGAWRPGWGIGGRPGWGIAGRPGWGIGAGAWRPGWRTAGWGFAGRPGWWRPGWGFASRRWGWGWPVAAAVGIGLGSYAYSYDSDCLAWDG